MYMTIRFFVALAGAACALSAHAAVTVSNAWARATVPAQTSSGAYLQVMSTDAARLVGVSTPAAGMAELHQMSMRGDTMEMHPVDAVALPAGQPVDLAHGYHVMLMDLKQPLTAGTSITLTLTVEHAGHRREQVTVQVPVKPITTRP
jgi:copper(I)-binding protein